MSKIESVFDTPWEHLSNEQVCLMLKASADTMSDAVQASMPTASLMYEAIKRIEKLQQNESRLVVDNATYAAALVEYAPKCRVCGVGAETSVYRNGGICNDCKA